MEKMCVCHPISLNCVCRYLVTTLMGTDCVRLDNWQHIHKKGGVVVVWSFKEFLIWIWICMFSHFEKMILRYFKSLTVPSPLFHYCLAMQPLGPTSLVPAIPRRGPSGLSQKAAVPPRDFSTGLPCAAVLCGCWWRSHGRDASSRPLSMGCFWWVGITKTRLVDTWRTGASCR
jgi:hypothetical protein